MNVVTTVPPVAVAGINTGIPLIGVIDPRNPLEWAVFGGMALSLVTMKTPSALIVCGALLALRYGLGKVSL